MKIEFFWTTNKTRLMIHDLESDDFDPLTLKCYEILRGVDIKVRDYYPETYAKLCKIYGKSKPYRFARVNRFLKCNFSEHDNHPDIDDDFNFDFERVSCPLRGECKDAICEPVMTTKLTDREVEVIGHHVDGATQQEIGERLFISPSTAHNHITNIYKKLGFTGKNNPDKLLINYAYKNKLI